MTALPLSPTFSRRLVATLQAAKEQSRRRGEAVLASCTAAVEDEEPLALFRRAGAGERVFWEGPEAGASFVGSGVAWSEATSGPDRFASLEAAWAQVVDGAVLEVEPAYPLPPPVAFAGFRFGTEGPVDPAWQAYPDGLVWLPRLLFLRRDGHAWLTANLIVDAAADPDAASEALLSELAAASPEAEKGGLVTPASGSDPLRRDRWEREAAALIESIEGGGVEKVVLARQALLSAAAPFDVVAAIDRLRGRYAGCSVFAVGRGDSTFLGASPESLVRLDGRALSLDCLAGSAARGATAAADDRLAAALLADPKERHEHDLVLRDLVATLTPLCDDLDVPAEPTLKRLANVQHLHRRVRGRAKPATSVLQLAEHLHPTAATGGLPRRAALSLIRTFEPADRGWYAAPLGWLDGAGGGSFAVAIRSALVTGAAARLYAGCGIVAGSDPAREFEESSIKLAAMRWALGGTEA